MDPERIQEQVARMADLAWAAGVLDLRGNFNAPERKCDKRGYFNPRITYRSTRLVGTARACGELHRILGGAVSHGAAGSGGRLVWTVSGARACLEVDELLLPYLRVRGRRVQMHAELCRMIRDYKPASFEERTLPVVEVQARVKLRNAMMGL